MNVDVGRIEEEGEGEGGLSGAEQSKDGADRTPKKKKKKKKK